MGKTEQLDKLMEEWKQKHINNGYKHFISDGIVCEEKWNSQTTPRVCFFLKEAYTDEEGFDLTEYVQEPKKMWKKVAIWVQAIHNAFSGKIVEYNDGILRSNEKQAIETIAIVNIKKSDGEHQSNYEDLEKFAVDDKKELKKELEIIQPDIIVCGNNYSLLKEVLGDELNDGNVWDNLFTMWNNTLVINYYHPAVQYANRVNYYALTAICNAAIQKYHLDFKH